MEKEITNRELELITRYLENTANSGEIEEVLSWLSADDKNKLFFIELKKIWLESQSILNPKDEKVEKAWERISRRIEESADLCPHQSFNHKLFCFIKYAAIFLLILCSGILLYQNIRFYKSNQDTFTEVTAPYGSKTNLILPDGTKLWLNSGSKIRYSNHFGDKIREVYLEGEAYFDVAKKNGKLFLVKTSDIIIQVTGTAFDVKAYSDDDKVETTLVRGSVKIGRKDVSSKEFVVLRPNQKIIFSKNAKNSVWASAKNMTVGKSNIDKASDKSKVEDLASAAVIVDQINTRDITAWRDGKFIMHGEFLSDLTKMLERRYNVTFHFEDENLKNIKYTGTLKDLTLEQVLEAMKITSPIDYWIREKDVYLTDNKNFKYLSE
ncbi:MAG: FecR family protein [Bacteroidota bacterium]|nr:FecR family protein [Bacteroidota bacterium]